MPLKKIVRVAWLLLVALSANVSTVAGEEKVATILIVGDSLSAGYRMAAEQSWPALLQAKLDQQQRPYRVVNAAISGATSAAGLQLLPALLRQHQPRVLLLELGANDGLQGKPLTYIRHNLAQLIALAQAAGAEVLLIGVRLPPNYGSAYSEPFFNQYAELAQQYQTAYLPFLLEGIAGDSAQMMDDGLHPRAEMQPRVLANVWPVLEGLLAARAK